jgi:hypothetical protein
MHASELPASPDLSTPTIPVICDQCRATGFAADEHFSAIPDILNFAPVPRRAHANGWTPQQQRAFVAALAITGSAKQAARAIGRHEFGAQQLRTAKGGRDFALAWDAAMDLARERETQRIHGNLAELAEQRDAELATISPLPHGGGPVPIHPDCDYDPEYHTDGYPEYWQAMRNIRTRLLNCRRAYLMAIAADPEKRRAWEVLVGPTDWDRAERMEPQDDEPIADPERRPNGMPSLRKADMVLTVGSGLLPELTGGEDALAELRAELSESAESSRQRRLSGGQSSMATTDGEADALAWSRDEHRSHAGVHGEKRNEPDRPGSVRGASESFDVTDSFRDGQGHEPPAPTRSGIDPESDAMLEAIAAAREAHPGAFD